MQGQSKTLLTDFYQLSMAYAYWKAGIDARRSVFHLFFRRAPFKGGFTIACGLEGVIHFIESFHFEESDIAYLASLQNPAGHPYFDDAFLDMLRTLRLQVNIDAMPEGTPVFAQEPLLRVEGPLLQCQLLESPLLNLINFPTLIATKAARVCLAAEGDPVLEFGLRRAQGIDGAMTASRAAFVGGCHATSNVLAGKTFGIPVKGTQAHSWVMAFEDEEEAFSTYARILPECALFLVDTYDSLKGVEKAIRVGRWLRSQGHDLKGIRLDSGDLAQLSIESRKMLDAAGFTHAEIMASNELDEIVISELKHQGAKISAWGVGTHLVTGKDQAALDGVYKLSALQGEDGEWKYTLKLSEQPVKVSNPGRLQVRRYAHEGHYIADLIYDEDSGIHEPPTLVDPFDHTKQLAIDPAWKSVDVLVPVIRSGASCYALPPLEAIRRKTGEELGRLPKGVKRFLNPHIYPVGLEKELYQLKVQLIRKIRRKRAAV